MDLSKYPNVRLIKHPLLEHKLGIMRNKNTGSYEFRALVEEVTMLLGYEAMRNLETEEEKIETPICETTVRRIGGKKLVIVPILRAGLGMCDGLLRLVPTAKVGHEGFYREPKTHRPVCYYDKLPKDMDQREAFIVDPMLATGGSAADAATKVKGWGCQKVHFLCIVSVPEGIKYLTNAHPDVEIITAAIDSRLNEHAYIVPGLGDAGDRIFGTK